MKLDKGTVIPEVRFRLTADSVRDYVAAVEDEAIGALGEDVAPPMAVAAFAIRGLLEEMGLPEGALHAGQELEYHRPARVGETLTLASRVASAGVRKGWLLASVDLDVRDEDGATVMRGRSTVSAPVEENA